MRAFGVENLFVAMQASDTGRRMATEQRLVCFMHTCDAHAPRGASRVPGRQHSRGGEGGGGGGLGGGAVKEGERRSVILILAISYASFGGQSTEHIGNAGSSHTAWPNWIFYGGRRSAQADVHAHAIRRAWERKHLIAAVWGMMACGHTGVLGV